MPWWGSKTLLATLCGVVKNLPYVGRRRGTNHVEYNIRRKAFESPLYDELPDLAQQRDDEYTPCPLEAEHLQQLFLYFVKGPGGPFDGIGGVGGALWRKVWSIQLGAKVDCGLYKAMDEKLGEWKKATKDFTDFGALPKPELEIAYLANLFFRWVKDVRAEILAVDKLKVSNIHIQFYGWEDEAEPYTGTLHADLRLEAVMPGDLARVLLPAADCYDRPLLFVIANGVLRQGGSVFSFAWTHARVVGVAFGAIVMNAVGCGALELVPAGKADLSGSGDDANADAVHALHGAHMVGPGSARERGTSKLSATVVMTGHEDRDA